MFDSATCTEQDVALYPQFYISNLCSIDLQLMPQPPVALETAGHRIFALWKYTRCGHSNDTPHSCIEIRVALLLFSNFPHHVVKFVLLAIRGVYYPWLRNSGHFSGISDLVMTVLLFRVTHGVLSRVAKPFPWVTHFADQNAGHVARLARPLDRSYSSLIVGKAHPQIKNEWHSQLTLLRYPRTSGGEGIIWLEGEKEQ